MKRFLFIKLHIVNLFCFILFFIDSMFHIGRHIGSVDILRPLLMFFLLLSCLNFFLKNKGFYSSFYTQIIIIYYMFLIISYFRAIIFNQNMEIANEFILYYIYLFFFPVLINSIRTKKELFFVLHAVLLLGTFISLLCLTLVVTDMLNVSIVKNIFTFLEDYNLGFLLGRSNGFLRFISTSVTVQVMAYFFSIYFLLSKKKIFYSLFIIINILAIFITFTRGLWLGVAAGTVFLILKYSLSNFQSSRKLFLLTFLVFILLVISIIKLNQFNSGFFLYAIERLKVDSATKASDNFRLEMLHLLNELIGRHILIGNGAGAHINLRTGRTEMSFHDIASKIGMLGLIVFLLPFIVMLFEKNVKTKYFEFRLLQICVLSALLSLVVATNTNPYFITSFGLFLYCLCMRIYSYRRFPISGFNLEAN